MLLSLVTKKVLVVFVKLCCISNRKLIEEMHGVLCSISEYLCFGWLQLNTRILLFDFLEMFAVKNVH